MTRVLKFIWRQKLYYNLFQTTKTKSMGIPLSLLRINVIMQTVKRKPQIALEINLSRYSIV